MGFSVHTGWAAGVLLAAGPPRLLDRRRVELAAPAPEARFIYHRSAEAPARAGTLIEAAAAEAAARAGRFLSDLAAAWPDLALVVALPVPRALPPLERILAAHPLLHAAEGELFRTGLAEGAARAGLELRRVVPGSLPRLGTPGPPWGQDQRVAAALAWAALDA